MRDMVFIYFGFKRNEERVNQKWILIVNWGFSEVCVSVRLSFF